MFVIHFSVLTEILGPAFEAQLIRAVDAGKASRPSTSPCVAECRWPTRIFVLGIGNCCVLWVSENTGPAPFDTPIFDPFSVFKLLQSVQVVDADQFLMAQFAQRLPIVDRETGIV